MFIRVVLLHINEEPELPDDASGGNLNVDYSGSVQNGRDLLTQKQILD